MSTTSTEKKTNYTPIAKRIIFYSTLLIATFLFAHHSFATNLLTPPTWEGEDQSIKNHDNIRVYQNGFFRIFYYTQGEHKVNPQDEDNNNVPDYVEDVAKQLWASHRIFHDIYGFPHPLGSPHYKNVTNSIDVYIVYQSALKNSFGATFVDPVQAPLQPTGTQALQIYILKTLDFRNSATIAHEYFHLVQNGLSKVRNQWYFEGLARWAENSVASRKYYIDPNWSYEKLINSKDVLLYLQTMSYRSGSRFWVPLSKYLDNKSQIPLPKDDPLRTLTYSNGTKVVKDLDFQGAKFVKELLLTLNIIEKQIEAKYKISEWNRELAMNRRNNPYIVTAIKQAVKSYQANN